MNIEDATNPVREPEAAEGARQTSPALEAAFKGLEAHFANPTRPRATLQPSPGQVARRALERVEALEGRVIRLEMCEDPVPAYRALEGRVEALEDGAGHALVEEAALDERLAVLEAALQVVEHHVARLVAAELPAKRSAQASEAATEREHSFCCDCCDHEWTAVRPVSVKAYVGDDCPECDTRHWDEVPVPETADATEREDAVFAAGFRAGVFEGGRQSRYWKDQRDAALARWVASGRKTHLDEEA